MLSGDARQEKIPLVDAVFSYAVQGTSASVCTEQARDTALNLLGNLCLEADVRYHVVKHHTEALPAAILEAFHVASLDSNIPRAHHLCSLVINLSQSKALQAAFGIVRLPAALACIV